MMWISGFRGAMTYALALESSYIFIKDNGDVILLLSMILVQMTVIVMTTLLYPIIRCLDIASSGLEDTKVHPIENSGPITNIKKRFHAFHENVMKPIFSENSLMKGKEVLTIRCKYSIRIRNE